MKSNGRLPTNRRLSGGARDTPTTYPLRLWPLRELIALMAWSGVPRRMNTAKREDTMSMTFIPHRFNILFEEVYVAIQYRPEGLQHLRARKMRVKEGPYARVIFYAHFYTHLNYTQIACISKKKRNPLLFIHALCVYFSGSEVKNVAVDLYRTCNSQAIIGNS